MQTKLSSHHFLKVARVFVRSWLCLLLLAAGFVQAQIQDRPKVGPELKKLEMFVGDWKYQGSVSDTPLGPAGKFAGTATNRMILDGLFLEIRSQDKGVYGGKENLYQGLTVRRFDATSKRYVSQTYDTDGMVATEIWTLDGSTWKTAGTTTDPKGKAHQTRSSATFSPDGTTLTFKAELLADDGKTWLPYWEDTATKVKSP